MNKITNPTLKKELKKVNNLLIISICFIVLSIVLILVGIYDENKATKEAVYLNDVIEAQNNKEDVNARLTVVAPPYSFAKYNDDVNNAFYIVRDNDYYYIVYMSDSLYNKLNTDDINEHSETIYGKTVSIPTDVQELAVETWNEGLEEEQQISLDDFNSYFGLVYLDTTSTSDISTILYVLAMIISIVGVILLITYIIKKIMNNKAIKKLDEEEIKKIEAEIEEKEAFHYKKANLILTKNYIISFTNGLTILNYQDVIWIYERKLKQYGITTQDGIVIMDKKGKNHNLAFLDGVTKKSKAILEEIMETIINKNANILVGYTKENQKSVKEKIEK